MRSNHPLYLGSTTLLTLLLGTTLTLAQPKEDEGEKKGGDDESEESDSNEPAEANPDAEEAEGDEKSEETVAESDEEKAASEEGEEGDAPEADKEEEPKLSDEPPGPLPPPAVKAGESAKAEVKEEEPKPEEPTASEGESEEAVEAALTDFPDNKPKLTPFDVSTMTFSRFEVRENYDELGISEGRTREGDQVVFRARLGLQTNPLPVSDGSDVSVKIAPQASGRWGENGFSGEANLGIYEGYIEWRSPRLETKLGRQMVWYGDEIIFGRAWWNEPGRTMDGLRFRYKMNKGYFDTFAFQVAETYPDGESRLLAGDEYVWGAYSGFGRYLGDDINTDLYFLGKTWIAKDNVVLDDNLVDIEEAHLFTVGGRVKHRVQWFDYRLEAGLQFGQTPQGELQADFDWEARNALAYNVDGEFGFWLSHGTRIGVGGVLVSGDDPTTEKNEGWDHMYPAVHRWLGRMDVIGIRTNLIAGRVNIKRNLTQDLRMNLEGHIFAREKAGGRGQVPQIDESGQTVNNGADMAGVEVDLGLKHALGEFSYVSALYGLFIPSTGHYASDDLVSYGELQGTIEF